MNEDGVFYTAMWCIVLAGVCVIALTVGSCTMAENKLIAQSPDPVATSCAISGVREVCAAVRIKRDLEVEKP